MGEGQRLPVAPEYVQPGGVQIDRGPAVDRCADGLTDQLVLLCRWWQHSRLQLRARGAVQSRVHHKRSPAVLRALLLHSTAGRPPWQCARNIECTSPMPHASRKHRPEHQTQLQPKRFPLRELSTRPGLFEHPHRTRCRSESGITPSHPSPDPPPGQQTRPSLGWSRSGCTRPPRGPGRLERALGTLYPRRPGAVKRH